MEFRDLGNGNYFPPVLRNGLIYGYVPGVTEEPLHLMTLTDEGLQLAGLLIEWSYIEGVSVDDGKVFIHNNVFLVRDFVYCVERMSFCESAFKEPTFFQQGYSIYLGLLNRITYEQQRLKAMGQTAR